MDLVYASGEKLETFTPELCLSPAPTGACDESRRISMCFAIKKVCGTTACQALTCTPSPQNVTALLAPPPVPTGDPGPVMSFPPELYNVVYGQPGTPVCPDCSLKVPGANNKPWELHGDPNSSLDVPTTFFTSNGVNQITGMTLKLYDARGALLQTFSSVVTGALISPPGYSYNGTVTPTDQIGGAGTNSPAAGDISSATLTWTQHFSLGGSSLVSHEIRIVAGP